MTRTESAIDRDELRAAARDMLDDTSSLRGRPRDC